MFMQCGKEGGGRIRRRVGGEGGRGKNEEKGGRREEAEEKGEGEKQELGRMRRVWWRGEEGEGRVPLQGVGKGGGTKGYTAVSPQKCDLPLSL